MDVRTLRKGEREALLDLLDQWEMPDGWRGRDFFRRYLEDDPTYRDENVWVAVEGERLLSCVQIFPRQVRVAGESVPLGGIGSVFTCASARKRGLAEGLLARAVTDMRDRGMELSLLFATRIPWYTKLGWASWSVERCLLRGSGAAPSESAIPFEPGRDLAGVRALHGAYAARLSGPAVRDAALWDGSLRFAGNPGEEFRVVRGANGLEAYGRVIHMEGARVLTEFARADGKRGRQALLDLLTELADDALVTPPLAIEPGLAGELAGRGVAVSSLPDPTSMLRCLDSEALARRLGIPAADGEDPHAFLRRVLPPARWLFWPADRF